MNSSRWVVAVLFVLTATSPRAESGRLIGRVVDADSGRPVAWANVGIRSLGIGTVADEAGRFELAVSAADVDVSVAEIGYAPKEIHAPDHGRRLEIALGRRLEPRGHGIGFASGQLGAQVGARIPVDRPILLRTANFVVTHDPIVFHHGGPTATRAPESVSFSMRDSGSRVVSRLSAPRA